MKLFRSSNYPTHWLANGPLLGWVMFPAKANGWVQRRPVHGIDPLSVQEIPVRMAFNTGFPGAPNTAANALTARFLEAA